MNDYQWYKNYILINPGGRYLTENDGSTWWYISINW